MNPCYSCKSQPEIINGPHGFYAKCPKCHVSTKAWSDHQAAVEDWDARMYHEYPAGMKVSWGSDKLFEPPPMHYSDLGSDEYPPMTHSQDILKHGR